MSAAFPTSSEPVSAAIPRAAAPLRVAMRSASAAGRVLAFRETHLASSAAVRISLNMSRSLLLAAPSVPRATLTPAATSRPTGQKPEASFRFDSGQWTTLAPARANSSTSSSSTWVMWTATRVGESRPSPSSRSMGRVPCRLSPMSISSRVSWTCMWMGISSSSARVRTRFRGSSETE